MIKKTSSSSQEPGTRSGEGADSVLPMVIQDASVRTTLASPAFDRHELTILVVDDNPAALYAMARTLEAAGYKTVRASGGAEALMHGADVAAAIIDVHLPDVHGIEVCRLLRNATKKPIPIVHVSAIYTEEAHRAQSKEAGADQYFISPVDPDVLVASMDILISKYASGEGAR